MTVVFHCAAGIEAESLRESSEGVKILLMNTEEVGGNEALSRIYIDFLLYMSPFC